VSAGVSTGIDVLIALIKTVPAIAELFEGLTGESAETVLERLERARAKVRDPIDTTPDDITRRAELERILRGGG
jgi:hypothetical protein